MFTINDDLSIYATRGDTVFFTVTADENGTPYTFQAGDVLRIKIYEKKNAENVVLEKCFPVTAATTDFTILLTEEDTKIGDVISKAKDFWYEIELNPFTNPQTIIGYDEDGPKVFKLFPEGADSEIPEVKPEDIPVVDVELDMTSNRPVQNQAISRAIVNLESAYKVTKEEVTEKANNFSVTAANIKNEMAVERARIDNLVSGATADDLELLDVRVSADGAIYESAGSAVRGQFAKKANMTDFNQMARLLGAEYGEVYTDSIVEAKLIGGYIHDSGEHPIYRLENSDQYQLWRYSVKKGTEYRLYGYHSISNGFPVLGFKTTANFEGAVEVLLTQDNNNTFLDFTYTPEENGYVFFAVITDLPIATMSEKTNTIVGIKEASDSVCRNIYCLGDSITYLEGSWAFKLAELIGANNVFNLGRGGAMWKDWFNTIVYDKNCPIWNNEFAHIKSADGKTESYPGNDGLNYNVIPSSSDYCTISNEIRFMDRLITEFGRPTPDIIIIACGTNDTNESAQEYSDEEFESIVNTKLDDMTINQKCTISGGIRWCIETLLVKYPDAELMVATPIQSNFSSKKPYYKRINAWLKKFAEYYSIKLIDAYGECGITSVFEKDENVEDRAGRYLIDGIHPNHSGNNLMAEYYAKQIKTKTLKN